MMDLAQRLVGQMRLAPVGHGSVAVGIDLTAAFHLGAALGVPARLIAEWMPTLEQVMVSEFNKRVQSGSGGSIVLGMEGGDV